MNAQREDLLQREKWSSCLIVSYLSLQQILDSGMKWCIVLSVFKISQMEYERRYLRHKALIFQETRNIGNINSNYETHNSLILSW